jgi:hypothetical protein
VTKVLPPGMVLERSNRRSLRGKRTRTKPCRIRMDLIRLLAIARWCPGIAYLLLGY